MLFRSTEGCRRRAPDFSDRLYAELAPSQPEPVRVRLIPYFAWLNRGNHQMRVWLPLA